MMGVLARVEDLVTEESLSVHEQTLAFSSPLHRDEIDPYVSFDSPFRSLSQPSVHDSFAKAPWHRLICLRLRQCITLPIRLVH